MKRQACFLAVALLAAHGHAGASEGHWALTLGGEFTTGDYGLARSTDVWYLPVTLRYQTGPWLLKLGTSWLNVNGPANLVDGASGVTLSASGRRASRTDAGPGDVIASASYAAYEDRCRGFLLDVTVKAKLGTADADKGLGTGENDYAVQADVVSTFGNWRRFAGIGWRAMGDTDTTDFNDPWFGSLGLTYKAGLHTEIGAAWDYRQAILDGGDALSELSLFATHAVKPGLKLQPYVVKGMTDASPDWGAGVLMTVGF